MHVAIAITLGLLTPVTTPVAPPAVERASGESRTTVDSLDAREAVRYGNERLRAAEPVEALAAYRHAESLEPEAREIAFVEGLAHFDLREYDKARDAFRRAAGLENDRLAADALYSLGATDHAEAISALETNPQLALSQLESGMRRYHDVLAQQPDHQAAREANLRAAAMWRQLKRQMEQQQQQQQDQDQGDPNEEREEKDQQQQQGEKQEEEHDKQSQPDEQQNQKQQGQQSASEEQSDEQQQPARAEEQDQVSREQAERRLREMMQAIRDRKKMRREHAQRVPVAPVEKDW